MGTKSLIITQDLGSRNPRLNSDPPEANIADDTARIRLATRRIVVKPYKWGRRLMKPHTLKTLILFFVFILGAGTVVGDVNDSLCDSFTVIFDRLILLPVVRQFLPSLGRASRNGAALMRTGLAVSLFVAVASAFAQQTPGFYADQNGTLSELAPPA